MLISTSEGGGGGGGRGRERGGGGEVSSLGYQPYQTRAANQIPLFKFKSRRKMGWGEGEGEVDTGVASRGKGGFKYNRSHIQRNI